MGGLFDDIPRFKDTFGYPPDAELVIIPNVMDSFGERGDTTPPRTQLSVVNTALAPVTVAKCLYNSHIDGVSKFRPYEFETNYGPPGKLLPVAIEPRTAGLVMNFLPPKEAAYITELCLVDDKGAKHYMSEKALDLMYDMIAPYV